MRLKGALMAGGLDDVPHELVEAERLFQIVQITGWSLDVIDECPAVVLDNLLAVAAIHREVEAERQQAASEVR